MSRYPAGSVRTRAYCPRCGRSIAVTFNKRTGEAYLRGHKADGAVCVPTGSSYLVGRETFHSGIQPRRKV